MNITTPTISISWSSEGAISDLRLGKLAVPQPAKSRLFLNGREISSSRCARLDSGQVVQESAIDGGRLRVAWSGLKRLSVHCQAEGSAPVEEVGFSMHLPPGTIRSLLTPGIESDLPPGRRVSFDDMTLAIGQFYLLDFQGTCLRIGRQVSERKDYTTGYLERTSQGFELVWKWQPQRPFPRRYESQALQFEVFDSASAAVEEHRRWMEKAFGLVPCEQNPKVPPWFRKTRLVIQAVLGESNGAVVHDYVDIRRMIEDLHAMGVPEETILYIPDYNMMACALRGCNGPIVALWPESPLLGGRNAFIGMIETARKYRYHIMPHSSIVLLIERARMPFAGRDGKPAPWWINPEWEEMKQWAVADAKGNPIGWPPSEEELAGSRKWRDRHPYVVRYLNQAVPEVQRFFVEGNCRLLDEFSLDCLHMDSLTNNCCRISAWNAPSEAGARAAGEREIIGQIYQRFPHVLLAAEGCDEQSLGLTPACSWRMPLHHALMGRYIYTFSSIVEPSPIPQRYADTGTISNYEEDANNREIRLSRRQPNNIPRLLVNYRDYGLDARTRKCIEELLSSRRA